MPNTMKQMVMWIGAIFACFGCISTVMPTPARYIAVALFSHKEIKTTLIKTGTPPDLFLIGGLMLLGFLLVTIGGLINHSDPVRAGDPPAPPTF